MPHHIAGLNLISGTLDVYSTTEDDQLKSGSFFQKVVPDCILQLSTL
jgi:hypothetical protein